MAAAASSILAGLALGLAKYHYRSNFSIQCYNLLVFRRFGLDDLTSVLEFTAALLDHAKSLLLAVLVSSGRQIITDHLCKLCQVFDTEFLAGVYHNYCMCRYCDS